MGSLFRTYIYSIFTGISFSYCTVWKTIIKRDILFSKFVFVCMNVINTCWTKKVKAMDREEAAALKFRIERQVEKVKQLKKEKAEKEVINEEKQKMIKMKAEYHQMTGESFF